jgi:hypothetical protein
MRVCDVDDLFGLGRSFVGIFEPREKLNPDSWHDCRSPYQTTALAGVRVMDFYCELAFVDVAHQTAGAVENHGHRKAVEDAHDAIDFVTPVGPSHFFHRVHDFTRRLPTHYH